MSTETLPADTVPRLPVVVEPNPPPKRVEGGCHEQATGSGGDGHRRSLLALLWLFPLLWALINSFREYDYTQANGYLSFGGWTTSATTRKPGPGHTSGST